MPCMPRISVIVPVYKVEQYLPKCIESILEQSLADFELILVDDGSPDGSGAICDRYAQRDSRLRVVHKPNGGVSAARNTALDLAAGQWVTFIDSDDWVAPHYLETLLGLAEGDGGFDLVIGGYTAMSGNKPDRRLAFPDAAIGSERFADLFTKHRIYDYGYIASKLYRRELVEQHGLRFNTAVSLGEDSFFMLDYLCHASRVRLISVPDLYFYNFDTGASLTRSCRSFGVEKAGYEAARQNARKFSHLGTARELGLDIAEHFYLQRTITALYASGMTRSQRIAELKQLDTSVLAPASRAATWKERILNLLLVWHCWHAYDALMSRA